MTNDRTLRAGVIGWPIEHSKSPRMHNAWLKAAGVDGVYERVAAAPDDFETVVRDLSKAGWRGANVTIPHKEAALAMADRATDRAAAIGAANTLIFGEGGSITADNTDGFGFIANLEDRAGDAWRSSERALVLGAGGAARAIIWALLDAGASEIRLANRSRDRAETLAADFGEKVETIEWTDASTACEGVALIVNTTSLGMTGQPPLPLSLDAAPSDAVVYDIVYTPLETPLLAAAKARALATVDGLGMLIHQGRPGFKAWFGVMPEVDEDLRMLMLAP